MLETRAPTDPLTPPWCGRSGLAGRSRRRIGVVEGAGRESQPGHVAGVAETVEPSRFVLAEASPEQLGFPAGCGRLVALQLLEHGDQAGLAGELRARSDVLPAQEEPHEVLSG